MAEFNGVNLIPVTFVLHLQNAKGSDPMTEEGVKRKLSDILSADVAGYSRLMGEDDDATVRPLTDHR